MRVLGIESSCDETGVALWESQAGLLGHRIYSQTAIHARYGGVVPELASRDHIRRVAPLTEALLGELDTSWSEIDGVTVTAGPGLVGSLLVGLSVAKAIAFARCLPFLGVHHLEGHLLAPALEFEGRVDQAVPEPFVALLVSGGHTLLARVSGVGRYRVLGQTLDDAAGEAFDKTAKLLGLGFPGGPAVAQWAVHGDPSAYPLPRPMVDRPNLDFSFSGLKTAVLNYAKQAGSAQETAVLRSSKTLPDTWGPYTGEANPLHKGLTDRFRSDLCASFQEAVAETLWFKSLRALRETGLYRLVVSGGVGANRYLRSFFETHAATAGYSVCFPSPEFCTDNAAMIAFAGGQRLLAGERHGLDLSARARWPLEELSQLDEPRLLGD